MSDLQSARNRLANEFGNTVAEKASDAFVMAHAGQRLGMRSFEEGGAPGAPSRIPTIIELAAEAMAPVRVRREAMERARGIAEELFAEMGQEHADLYADAPLRRRMIERHRDTFLHDAGGMFEELSRASAGPLGPLHDAVIMEAQPQLVECCWLNATMRTMANARTVAVVADDPRVKMIDIPRRIEPDIHDTVTLIGAVAYREARGVTGRGINVAVIDTEVSRQHLAFGNRVIHKANYTKEPFGHPGAHGTAVAGIIGCVQHPVTGVAPEVTFYNYKVIASVGVLNADDFGGALAIQQALEDGAHIANCSWGVGSAGDGRSREALACNNAWALGLTIIKSAGNKGPSGSTLTSPADADGVIVVGATDRRGSSIARYSSRGPTSDGRSRPHMVAPGGTPTDPLTSCVTAGGLGFCGHGTSFAAPHVTGLVALMLAQDPALSPDDIRSELVAACNQLAGFSTDDQGAGLIRLG